jgi:replicative DNA helicase
MNIIQASALKAVLSKETYGQLANLLGDEVFLETSARKLYSIIKRLHDTADGDLDINDVSLDIEATYKLNSSVREELLSAVREVAKAQVPEFNVLQHTVRRAVSRDKWMKMGEYLAVHIDDEDFDPAVPAKMAQEASIMQSTNDLTIDDYASAPPPGDDMRGDVIPIGIHPDLDDSLDGGGGSGELMMYLAPSGVGKTSFLLYHAANSATLGRDVLYITLEINKRKCFTRIDQYLTKMTKRELIADPFGAMRKRKSLGLNIMVKDWSHQRRVTVEDIRALVLTLRAQGTKVDHLFLDYMELVTPEYFNRAHPRFNYSAVARDLRALANELNINIVTAWQTNRAAADKQVLTKQDVGEDWGIVKIADIILGLNQTPAELRLKEMRINILKQRESTNRGIFSLHCDLDRMIVRPLEGAEPLQEDDYGVEKHSQADQG